MNQEKIATGEGMIICTMCLVPNLMRKTDLKNHIAKDHIHFIANKCLTCGVESFDEEELYRHAVDNDHHATFDMVRVLALKY